MSAITLKLNVPISMDGTRYESLKFHSFKVKHLPLVPVEIYTLINQETLADNQKIQIAIALRPLLAAIANVKREVIDEMSVEDMLVILDNFGSYFQKIFNQPKVISK